MFTSRRCSCFFLIVVCLKAAVGELVVGRMVYSCRLSLGKFPIAKNPCLLEVS